MHDWVYVFAAEVGRGVHMRDEAHVGRAFAARHGGQIAVYICLLIADNALQPHFLQFAFQHMREVKLARCGGYRALVVRVAGRIYLYIPQKSLC